MIIARKALQQTHDQKTPKKPKTKQQKTNKQTKLMLMTRVLTKSKEGNNEAVRHDKH